MVTYYHKRKPLPEMIFSALRAVGGLDVGMACGYKPGEQAFLIGAP
jgi:hypothetical protein